MNDAGGHGGAGDTPDHSGTKVVNMESAFVELDQAALTDFADRLADKHETDWLPRLQAAQDKLRGGDYAGDRRGGDPVRSIGTAGGECASAELGEWHAEILNQTHAWIEQLADGVAGIPLYLAAMVEAFQGQDAGVATEIIQSGREG